MTSSKSLFNFGIYKNIIKRFKWGSFLYFIILFFSLPFILLVQEKQYLLNVYKRGMDDVSLILTEGFTIFPVFLAMIVPTIVATLVFNNVHSSKQGNFIHSLPVTRLENYVSSILASMTLMIVPVLLNATILLIMSFSWYGQVISSASVIYWFFLNIAISFIMLSVSVFAAYLTGHTAAHIVINLLLHTAPLVLALGISLISEIFLFGFSQIDNFVAGEIVNNTPMVWLYTQPISRLDFQNIFLQYKMWIFIGMAIAFYALAFLLYKNRKIESCGDIAAFKVFRPILKYTATIFGAILMFGIFTSTNLTATAIFTIVGAATAIVYFASEMLIKKTVKVFRSYKGFIGFAVIMAIFISIFAYTDIFGFERRIPEKADIESATIYYRYGDNIPMVADDKLIEDVRSMHAELISDIPVVNEELDRYNRLFVKYELTNGKTLTRQYDVSDEVCTRALSKMYETTEYKYKIFNFDTINIEKVKNIDLRMYASLFNYHISVNEHSKKILDAIKKDLEVLSYDEIESQQFAINISLNIQQTAEENEKSGVFVTAVSEADYYSGRMYSFNMRINSNFKNTFALLKELGYYNEMIDAFSGGVKICTIPVSVKNDEYTFKNDTGKSYEFMINSKDMVSVNREDGLKLAEKLMYEQSEKSGKTGNLSDGEHYLVFCFKDDYQTVDLTSYTASFTENTMPDYLKKYLDRRKY